MSDNLVVENLGKPEVLESAYRKAPADFERSFKDAIKENPDSETLRVWQARLAFDEVLPVKNVSVLLVLVLCFAAWILTKLPHFLDIDSNWYYPRFVPWVVVSAVAGYFLFTTPSRFILKLVVFGGFAASIIYLFYLPYNKDSASVTMALLHLPLCYLSILALSFMAEGWNHTEGRLDYIRYLGEMGILSVMILVGGMVLTAITLNLFDLIALSIERWYMENIVVLGLVSSPIVATYVFDSIQHRQGRFASILAGVFSPLFLVTILVYLAAALYQGKSPFTDRDFLIIFNGLLLVILALTIFSITGRKGKDSVQASDYISAFLIVATLIVNVTALSAILFRWVEFGTTVNRIAVTGANILIFFHLVLLLKQYVNHLRTGAGIQALESTIASYLPLYSAWSLCVAVVLPVAFQFA